MNHRDMAHVLHVCVALTEVEGATGDELGIGGSICKRGVRGTVLLIPGIDEAGDLVVVMVADGVSRCVGISRIDAGVSTAGHALVNVDAGRHLWLHTGELRLEGEGCLMKGHGHPAIDVGVADIARITAHVGHQRVFVGVNVRRSVLFGDGVFDGVR